jgi:hypothetical protein
MSRYVVIEYECVDVRAWQASEPVRRISGEASKAQVVQAEDEASAIRIAAEGHEGFFAALPIPADLTLVQAELTFNA